MEAVHTEFPTYPRSSPSQIKTYIDCHRKWWYESVRKLRKPPTKAQAKGTAFHAICEHYLTTGEYPELEQTLAIIAENAREEDKDQPVMFEVTAESHKLLLWTLSNSFKFLDAVRENYSFNQVEGEFRDEVHYPVPIKGFSDFVAHSTSAGKIVVGKFTHIIDVNEMLVADHKSTSDWKYVKDEEELRHDPQAIIYCTFFLRKLEAEGKAIDHIKFLHHYILTADRKKPPEPRFTVIEMTREQLTEGVAEISKTLAEMVNDYVTNEKDVARNTDACSMYGGCPHSDYCEEKEVDEFMRQLLEGSHAAPAPTAAPAQAPAVVETPAGADEPNPEVTLPPLVEQEVRNALTYVQYSPGPKLILIDAILPRGVRGVTLEDFLRPVGEVWSKANKVDHYTLEKFNKGRVNVVHLGLRLKAPDVLLVNSRTHLGGEFLSYVSEYAIANPEHTIVQGTR